MSQYKYLIIDAQYYLRRNWSVVKYNEDFNKFKLIDSYLWTLLKVVKNYDFEKIIMLFDKRPYFKERVLEKYKKDRYLVGDDVDDTVAELQKPDLSDEQRKELEEHLKEAQVEYELFLIMGAAKYEFLTSFQTMGLVSYQKQGYEADDLAYLLGRLCSDNGESALLVSSDSDWIYSVLPHVDFYRMNKSDNSIYTYDRMKSEVQKDISVYKFGRMNELLNFSHNNVDTGIEVNFNNEVDNYIKNKSLSTELLNKYFNAMDYDNYYDDMKSELDKILHKSGSIVFDEWINYHDSNGLEIFTYYYWKYISKLNKDLYKD